MSKMKPITSGYVKYRDGRKWKKRYCALYGPSLASQRTKSELHFYLFKSYDDFEAAERSRSSRGSSYAAAATSSLSQSDPKSYYVKPTTAMFHGLTGRSNYYCNVPHTGSGHSGYVSNPVTEMCNQADKALATGLEQANAAARASGTAAPVDAVLGFEQGCHLNGESNVILLIGLKTVHAIAHPSVDEMFNWAEILNDYLLDSSYHVTLCLVSSCEGSASSLGGSSRLQVGLQASMHVQKWRVCLIGEPSAGCQFIASWRLDTINSAYAIETARTSDSGQHLLGFTPPSDSYSFGTNSSPSSSSPAQNEDRFILQTSRMAGKGLAGNYTFQVDGRRLEELKIAMGDLLRRGFDALTVAPGSSFPSMTACDGGPESTAAIMIKGKRGLPCEPPASSLSPPGRESASPHTPPAPTMTFTASSLPCRGGEDFAPHHLSSTSSSTRSKKSSSRQLFTPGYTQTLGRSSAINIPCRGSVTSKTGGVGVGDNGGVGGGGPRRSSSSKAGSVEGSGGSSSEASLAKPPTLFYPSVKVGAGIITSLIPGPPPSKPPDLFGEPPTAPPPPSASSRSTQKPSKIAPLSLPNNICDRCRRGNKHQRTHSADPASVSSEEGGSGNGVFAADEDVDQTPMSDQSGFANRLGRFLQIAGIRQPAETSGEHLYALCKHLYRTVIDGSLKRQPPSPRRSRTPDMCSTRRRNLARDRIFWAFGGAKGENSPLEKLLLRLASPTACVFLLGFSQPGDRRVTEDYKWFLVHRPGHCCSRCCLWDTPILAGLNLQELVAQQKRMLSLRPTADGANTSCSGAMPCLSTSCLAIWQFAPRTVCGTPPRFGETPHSHRHRQKEGGGLPRPWSVLYFEDEEGDKRPSPPPSAQPPQPCCTLCGSPSVAPSQQRKQKQQQHLYANLITRGGSSTLPNISKRSGSSLFSRKKNTTPARDCIDGRRFGGYTSSASCSTSQASSPSSPQSQQAYCNLFVGNGSAAYGPPNPLKQPAPPPYFHEERAAYANLPHLNQLIKSPHRQKRVPDEIREPKRNYALVDLRPSPASSVIAPGETLQLVPTVVEDTTSSSTDLGDSSASTLHTNVSTSSSTIVPGGSRPTGRRRRSSHSLSAVLPVPALNYVHIMTSASVEKKEPSWEGSAASSTSASSTASSSEKEQHAPAAAEVGGVPYAQIDFARTRALNAVNGAEVSAVATQEAPRSTKGGGGGGLRSLNVAHKKSDAW